VDLKHSLFLEYAITCPAAGLARFEGLRVEMADHQGMFAGSFFLRQAVQTPILPAVVVPRGGPPLTKESNAMPPPGTHRLLRAGSGSELLDLRDYQPGDPPRTIAWKVSARREKLITREFESEVPVWCMLFVDTSSSVLLPSPLALDPGKPERPVDRLIALAAALIRTNATRRDMTGLCVFDEDKSRILRPERGRAAVNALMRALGLAAAAGPRAHRADPEPLLPLAVAFAEEVYPELMRSEVNAVPMWLAWLVGGPAHTPHWRGWLDWLNRRKRTLLLWGTTILPLGLFLLNIAAALSDQIPTWGRTTLGAFTLFGLPLLLAITWLVFVFTLTFAWKPRKRYRWRKRMAALLGHLHCLPLGSVELLIQDDDRLSTELQKFLSAHQVPYALPLYDERGRYLLVAPQKAGHLARALLDASARGRDNELYVLMVDLLELEEGLEPILAAVKVARARHHQVVIVQPWPRGVPLPDKGSKENSESILDMLRQLLTRRLHAAFTRVRREFARLGVATLCAEADDAERLVLERMERLRQIGGRR
jgi:uncharacterized protein (DUF58 family)